jgi:hypothetical protein
MGYPLTVEDIPFDRLQRPVAIEFVPVASRAGKRAFVSDLHPTAGIIGLGPGKAIKILPGETNE